MAARAKQAKEPAVKRQAKPAPQKPAAKAGRVPSALTKALGTDSFADYLATLSTIQRTPEWPDGLVVADFLLLLRPYYWYVSSPGFQDLMDAATTAHAALVRNAKLLADELSASGLPQFLEGYVNHESLDGTGWDFLASSAELAAALDAEAAGKHLAKARKVKDAAALVELARLFRAVEGAKHLTYRALRVVGPRFLDHLEALVHKLAPDDQGFVLQALDGAKKDRQVVAFYQRFIEETEYDGLAEEAAGYLKRVR